MFNERKEEQAVEKPRTGSTRSQLFNTDLPAMREVVIPPSEILEPNFASKDQRLYTEVTKPTKALETPYIGGRFREPIKHLCHASQGNKQVLAGYPGHKRSSHNYTE